MKIYRPILLVILFLFQLEINGQHFTKYDSLRGSLNPLRSCYDVTFYDLNLDINILKRSIQGSNKIYYRSIADFKRMQIDLFSVMKIDSILYKKEKLSFSRDSNVVYIDFSEVQIKDKVNSLEIFYRGIPLTATNPPWEGGFVWKTDSLNYPWVAVACEGLGASSWWPCKDHFSDEPDSMQLTFTIPSGLSCISNGNLIRKKESGDGKSSFTWKVTYPINTYNATLNIGRYGHFSNSFISSDGKKIGLDYYVLNYHVDKAKKHFAQVSTILNTYEHFFGPYPFPRDGYALVETPYWGMEHQSAIAYGNNFENKLAEYDFIIVHETAHEWWGNSITASDVGELWIHESFATYSEALLLEHLYGLPTSIQYLQHQEKYIKNKKPLLKPLGVNFFDSEDSDIYYKGAWMLHTLRNTIANDSVWFSIIYGLATEFKHSTVTTEKVIRYFNDKSKIDLSSVFDQYLNYTSLPTFVYQVKKKGKKTLLTYRWISDVENINLPVFIITKDQKIIRLYPRSENQTYVLTKEEAENLRIMTELFYIKTENLKKKK